MKQSVKMIVGNWKMNGLAGALDEARAIAEAAKSVDGACRVALCPPATLVERMAAVLKDGAAAVGGQDCHAKPSGAFTRIGLGRDAGGRRRDAGDPGPLRTAGRGSVKPTPRWAAKVEAAVAAGLEPIVCVGETLAQREAGDAIAVVSAQVEGSLARQPVGTAVRRGL
ncbi:triose-phosphate isomerase [Brevundimonas sp.]|uniref:triose-phosphate isomerase n=1 Tax=Brevundimonas sp. TaxID=1871086 RepID=UPI003BAD101D